MVTDISFSESVANKLAYSAKLLKHTSLNIFV